MQTQSAQVTLSLNENVIEPKCVPILTFVGDNVLALHDSTDDFKGALFATKIETFYCPKFSIRPIWNRA